jgi:integrase
MNGKGQIIPVERGKWRIRVQKRHPGKRKTISQTVSGTKQDAEKVLKSLLKQIETVQSKPKSVKTVQELFDEYLTVHAPKITERTLHTYKKNLAYFAKEFGKVYAKDITAYEIEKFFVKYSRLSGTTLQKTYSQAKTAFKKAVQWRWIAENPFETIQPPRIKRNEKEVLSIAEFQQFYAACPRTKKTFWLFAVLTGCRPQEIAAARWQDIDFKSKVFSVTQALVEMPGKKYFADLKTVSSRRTIPIACELIDDLNKHRKQQNIERMKAFEWADNDLIFPTSTGNPIRLSNLGEKCKRICEQAKITKNITPHSFRHTFATLSLESGVNLKLVSMMLGHASITITANTYLHPDLAERQKATQILTDLILKSA